MNTTHSKLLFKGLWGLYQNVSTIAMQEGSLVRLQTSQSINRSHRGLYIAEASFQDSMEQIHTRLPLLPARFRPTLPNHRKDTRTGKSMVGQV